MRRYLAGLAAALIIITGGAEACAPAGRGPAVHADANQYKARSAHPSIGDPSGWSTCAEAQANAGTGNFVCYDPGWDYAHANTVTIYVNGAMWASFAVSGNTPMVAPFGWPPQHWIFASAYVTFMKNPFNGNVMMYSQDQALGFCGPSNNCISMTAAHHDLLEWFSNDPNFYFFKVN